MLSLAFIADERTLKTTFDALLSKQSDFWIKRPCYQCNYVASLIIMPSKHHSKHVFWEWRIANACAIMFPSSSADRDVITEAYVSRDDARGLNALAAAYGCNLSFTLFAVCQFRLMPSDFAEGWSTASEPCSPWTSRRPVIAYPAIFTSGMSLYVNSIGPITITKSVTVTDV